MEEKERGRERMGQGTPLPLSTRAARWWQRRSRGHGAGRYQSFMHAPMLAPHPHAYACTRSNTSAPMHAYNRRHSTLSH
eukprot:6210540-Pleurochrysis_carterae.AAC.1